MMRTSAASSLAKVFKRSFTEGGNGNGNGALKGVMASAIKEGKEAAAKVAAEVAGKVAAEVAAKVVAEAAAKVAVEAVVKTVTEVAAKAVAKLAAESISNTKITKLLAVMAKWEESNLYKVLTMASLPVSGVGGIILLGHYFNILPPSATKTFHLASLCGINAEEEAEEEKKAAKVNVKVTRDKRIFFEIRKRVMERNRSQFWFYHMCVRVKEYFKALEKEPVYNPEPQGRVSWGYFFEGWID